MSSPLAGAEMIDLLRPRLQVLGGVVAAREEARGLEDDVDAEVGPRQVGRVALGEDLDLLAVDHEAVVVAFDRARIAAVGRVVAQQVRERGVVGDVVDGDPLDVGLRGLAGAEDVAADAAEAVDPDAYGHALGPSSLAWRDRAGRRRTAQYPAGAVKAIRPPTRADGDSTPAGLVTSPPLRPDAPRTRSARSHWASRSAGRSRRLASNSANSSRVRSRPPAPTSMLRSESLASAFSFGRAEVALDDEQRAVVGDRRTAAGQDRQRVVVLPVVQDGLEQVGVGALGHRLEEAAGDDLAALAEDRALDHVDLVEEHAAHLRVGPRESRGGRRHDHRRRRPRSRSVRSRRPRAGARWHGA